MASSKFSFSIHAIKNKNIAPVKEDFSTVLPRRMTPHLVEPSDRILSSYRIKASLHHLELPQYEFYRLK